ncbi:unnamed protein product [Dibothriocephalus latus]|uniref:Uncharacterized protein n=1 Tax=Dibothriocephalus latus TaxID=60516 RepID=A0A3P6U165_DIBLA|nr:unnamed protein product [Dibothriocephalus latus]
MIRLVFQDCHARLRKYCQIIDREKTKCCELVGEDCTKLLQQRMLERAREKQAIHEAALEKKCHKLQYTTSSRNDVLVNNLSSKEPTKEQIQVLQHETSFNMADAKSKEQIQVLQHKASFNTADAKPVNKVAAVESVVNQTDATEKTKNFI